MIATGQDVPGPFNSAQRFTIDDAVLAEPQLTADAMHRCWITRAPMVVELQVDPDRLRQRETISAPVHALPATTHLHRERLQFLTWANNYDLRSGEPIWWHGIIAQRRIPGAQHSAATDVEWTGEHLWVDGGPRSYIDNLDAPVVHRESLSLIRNAEPPLVQPRPNANAQLPDWLEQLAGDQQAAAVHERGGARVIAPAGSGKTRVLTARIRHLIEHCSVEPELITAVAYNTRAARQLQERLHDGGPTSSQLSIRTIHSLAYAICSLERSRKVVDERQVRTILQQLLRVPRIPNQDPYQPYLDALNDVRIGLRSPSEVEATRGDVDGLTELFDDYRQMLAEHGALDFDEQIYHAIELLLTRPDIRDQVQRQATHLLVDEFQDLTPAYLLLLRLIAGPSMQVFAVGDDDQTIYGYSGASPRYLVDFDRWFPGARELALHTNYRCRASIVTAAANLLSHNQLRVDKRIMSGRAGTASGAQPNAGFTVHRTARERSAELIANRVSEQLAGGTSPQDIAVLARVNSALLAVQVTLTQAGVPHSAPLNAQVLRRTGIRTALAYLHIACTPSTIPRELVLETINRPVRKIRSAIEPLLPRRAVSLARLRRLEYELHDDHRQRFADYLHDLEQLIEAVRAGSPTGVLLAQIRDEIGVGIAMDALDASRSRPEGSSHTDDLDALEQIAHLCPDPAQFSAWLAAQLGRTETSTAAVTLSTIHRVKGMQWPHVIVAGANAGLIPHRLADDIEEERRILHVAITRSSDTLNIVADEARPSPLLDDLDNPRRPGAPKAAESPKPQPAANPAPTADTEALFEQLRAWRSSLARMTGSPAFVIFHDRALRDIAYRQPTSLAELAGCNGVGPAKLERFGDDLLAIIDQHRRSTAHN